MKKNNRKCIVCGKEYSYCPSCKNGYDLPSWLSLYHDENCRTIFNIANNLLAGVITPQKAKKQFDACDLSGKSSFSSGIIKALDIAYAATVKTEEKTEEKLVIEESAEKPVMAKRGSKAKAIEEVE